MPVLFPNAQSASMPLQIACPASYSAERAYLLRHVFEARLGLAVQIVTSDEPDRAARTVISDGQGGCVEIPEGLFAIPQSEWLTASCRPQPRLLALGDISTIPRNPHGDIVAMFGPDADSRQAAYHVSEKSVALNFDALGGIFFVLTGMGEIINPARDAHGRFPGVCGLVSHPEFSSRPIVDETIALLAGCIDAVWPGLCKPLRCYRVGVSHDIDHPFLYHGYSPLQVAQRAARRVAGDFLLRKSSGAALASAGQMLGYMKHGAAKDPFFTFDALMDMSERHGLASCFYLIVDPNSDMDGRPYIDDPLIGAALKRVSARGHRIGLHASYACYGDPARASREAGILRGLLEVLDIPQAEIGVRQHYLRWSGPEHWRMWDDAGMCFDATLGFANRMGFRYGTSHPFPVFDLASGSKLNIEERPLLVMDAAILPQSESDWRRSGNRIMAEVSEVIDACRVHGGVFELLWHNTGIQYPFAASAYRRILDMACRGGVS